jgi:hypothetical protein
MFVASRSPTWKASIGCLLVLVVLAGCAKTTPPPDTAKDAKEAKAEAAQKAVHPVIEAYLESFGELLEPEELEQLAQLDLTGTYVGDTQRLRYLAADKAIRMFLPAALEATGDPGLLEYAKRVRALPPVMNPDTDAVAYALVAEALEAKKRYDLLTAAGVRPENVGKPREHSARERVQAIEQFDREETTLHEIVVTSERDNTDRANYADALADYAETYQRTYGVSPLQADVAAAAAADAADAAILLDQAIRAGASREALVSGGFTLIQEMADAARRRERIPAPRIPPKDPTKEDKQVR